MTKLNFSREEIIAIYKLAHMMAKADEVILSEESDYIAKEMMRWNLTDYKQIDIDNVNSLDSLNTIANLGKEEKLYVNAFLGTIISIDGDIDDRELALWRLLGDFCQLPKMTNRQAINLINDYK